MTRFLPAVLLCLATITFAQDRNQPRENLKATGTFRGAASGGFQIATEGNELWNVRLPARGEGVSFTGNAEASFLRPGMYVKFTGLVNKRKLLTEPIASITVSSPKIPSREDRDDDGPRVNPLGGLFTSEKPEEQPTKKPIKKPVAEPPQPYPIEGTIAAIKSGKITIAVGGVQIKGELADNVKVRVATSNLAFAQLGDKVEVDGWYYANAREQGAWANRVTVTAANTLEGEKKKVKTGEEGSSEKKPDDKKPADSK